MKTKDESQVCVFCCGQENGKPVALCSSCLTKLIRASPEVVDDLIQKHGNKLKPEQLHYLKSVNDKAIDTAEQGDQKHHLRWMPVGL